MANTSPVNVLSAEHLSHIILKSLPSSTESDPQLRNPFDAFAVACHAALLAVGFRLVGLGEDHRTEVNDSASVETPSLPVEWNASSGSYAFRYKHSQSSMEYLLKVTRLGNKIVAMATALGDDKTWQFETKVDEFISAGNLPATPKTPETPESDGKRKIQDIFISNGRLSDLGSLLRLRLIQKLMPSLQKEGYEEDHSAASSSQDQRRPPPQQPDRDPLRDPQPARPYPFDDPLASGGPRAPVPEPIPGFEDEHQIHPRRPLGGGVGGFPGYGHNDLYPQGLGPNDPLRGGVGPGLRGGFPGGAGGMHPSFEDPLFRGQGQGGMGFGPQAPPGSRYDPVGPRGGGHPRGAGMDGRPPNPFGGFGDGDFI
ncbi:hypothetical protein K431DRAFT_284731 [Polychaeton citri CBS 116435]|uniref:Proteasome inhibitor PI31 subunit n=1 Tax=Polychaeton citri CBS 116435 TaxID=1314669 RepID=A0A9P4Q9A2_9PEZI|nr:hypothetical protein K431DRAFT_284731 [Polychaeton citri CBS 116435]